MQTEEDSRNYPTDLLAALARNQTVEQRFTSLPPSHQREYLAWIVSAVKPATRLKRIQKTVERLALEG
ncbi:MAG: YdeI/OmpD-associated family protein [Leptospiraceae bacterium]|nr:YdeI/OmpD-associated family protein [Leptospiraceae bacterium]